MPRLDARIQPALVAVKLGRTARYAASAHFRVVIEQVAAYYNEIDPYAAQWLRNLIKAGHIAAGDVDERSIVDVRADDLRRYTQCHFFAGIGGWSLALRLAGWADEQPAWTGSCPCQPLSSAGKRQGHADKRHLWPAFYALINQCRPSIVFGEQVAGADGIEWFAAVRHDLEVGRYRCGAADLPAACVRAPHKRHRIWWVATDSDGDGPQGWSQGFEFKKALFRHEEFAGLVSDALRVSVPTGRFGALADGVSGRVGKLRAFGNAIVPQVAAAFIMSAAPAHTSAD